MKAALAFFGVLPPPATGAEETLAHMRVVQAGQLYLLLIYILPYVHLGPVAYGECPEMLSGLFLGIEYVPKLRTLVLGVPLSELVTVRESKEIKQNLPGYVQKDCRK